MNLSSDGEIASDDGHENGSFTGNNNSVDEQSLTESIGELLNQGGQIGDPEFGGQEEADFACASLSVLQQRPRLSATHRYQQQQQRPLQRPSANRLAVVGGRRIFVNRLASDPLTFIPPMVARSPLSSSQLMDTDLPSTSNGREPEDPCSTSRGVSRIGTFDSSAHTTSVEEGDGNHRIRNYTFLSPPSTPTNSLNIHNLSSTASIKSTGSSHSSATSASLMRLPTGECCSSSSSGSDDEEFLEEVGEELEEETEEYGMEEDDEAQTAPNNADGILPGMGGHVLLNRTPKSARSRHRSMMADTPSSSRSSPGLTFGQPLPQVPAHSSTAIFGPIATARGMAASPRCRLSYIRRDASSCGPDSEAAHERLTKASQQVSTIFDEFGLDEIPAADEQRKRARSLTEPITILTNAFLPQSCSPSPTRVDTQKQCYSPSTQQIVRSNIPYSPCPSPTPNASPTRSRIMRSLSPIVVRHLSKRRYTTSSSKTRNGGTDSDSESTSGTYWAAKRVCTIQPRTSTSPLVNERLTPYSFPSPDDVPSPIGISLPSTSSGVFERPQSRSSDFPSFGSPSSTGTNNNHSSSTTTIVSQIFGQPATTIVTSNGSGPNSRFAMLMDQSVERPTRFALPMGLGSSSTSAGGASTPSAMDSDADSSSLGVADDDQSIPDAPADPSPSIPGGGYHLPAPDPPIHLPSTNGSLQNSSPNIADPLILEPDSESRSSLTEPPPDPPMDQG